MLEEFVVKTKKRVTHVAYGGIYLCSTEQLNHDSTLSGKNRSRTKHVAIWYHMYNHSEDMNTTYYKP